MILLAIDPGHTISAMVAYDTIERRPVLTYREENETILTLLSGAMTFDLMVIEQIASYGMAVGEEVFETVFWSGRFAQACDARQIEWHRLKRLAVKMHLCRDSRAKDSNIRQALIDRFGPGKDRAIGLKKSPGPLFGISKDLWAALAVAVTWADQHASAPRRREAVA